MIRRFALYGFLKNQQYYEPFIVLHLLERGLSFTQIGLLVGIRELTINLSEIPSGAVADLYGRRRCMIFSFAAYIVSFACYALGIGFWSFLPAVITFALGDAFRTGTHKAMIFSWLESTGRTEDKVKIYGYTRSWSKLGSAASVVLATGLVFWLQDYAVVFWAAMVPYVIGIINFLGYPVHLDERQPHASIRSVVGHTWATVRRSLRERGIRRLMLESMGFEGVFKVVKDYLQPLLVATALTVPFLAASSDQRRSAWLVGGIYVLLHLGSAAASRSAHGFVRWCGDRENASLALWTGALFIYGGMLAGLYLNWQWLAIGIFVLLFLLQNLWRPILIARFDDHGTAKEGATMLSVESQAKSLAAMVLAPLAGWTVDFLRLETVSTASPFWPVAGIGLLATLAGIGVVAAGRSPR